MTNRTVTLPEEEWKLLSFALACFTDDYEKAMKKRGCWTIQAKEMHSNIESIRLLHINPEALCGDLILANGIKLKKLIP